MLERKPSGRPSLPSPGGAETSFDGVESQRPLGGVAAPAIERQSLEELPGTASAPSREVSPEVAASDGALDCINAEWLVGNLPPDWQTLDQPLQDGQGELIGGLPHGEWTLYYPAGEMAATGRFVLGSKEGRWQYFDASGKVVMVCDFLRGKMHGTARSWDERGGQWVEVSYSNGVLSHR